MAGKYDYPTARRYIQLCRQCDYDIKTEPVIPPDTKDFMDRVRQLNEVTNYWSRFLDQLQTQESILANMKFIDEHIAKYGREVNARDDGLPTNVEQKQVVTMAYDAIRSPVGSPQRLLTEEIIGSILRGQLQQYLDYYNRFLGMIHYYQGRLFPPTSPQRELLAAPTSAQRALAFNRMS